MSSSTSVSRAHDDAAIASSPIVAAMPKPSSSACASQPVMIRLRMPSIRYDTGLNVATVRNQSVSIRFRGKFIEDRKRRTKRSGKSPCTASPDPVRSAKNAPSALNETAISVASASSTNAPATPVSSLTPKASPIER